MKRANGFHRRTPKWCWALLVLAVALVLPGRELVLSQDKPGAQTAPPTNVSDVKEVLPSPPPRMTKAISSDTGPKPKRVVDAIRLQYALAADTAAAINDFLEKRQSGKNMAHKVLEDRAVVTAEPISNSLFVSAYPADFAEIKRMIGVIDVFPKQFLFEVIVCEGEPVPTLPEAIKKGTVDVLSRPQLLTLENQTALLNLGKEIEFPAGSGQRKCVGITVQVTAGRANGKQAPVRLVAEVSSMNEDQTTLSMQHTEHSTNMPLEQPVRIRGGKTNSGKELWIVMTVTEIASREQIDKLMTREPRKLVDFWPDGSK